MRDFAARIGLSGLAIAILLALLAVQTVRIEGFKVWPVSVKGWKQEATELRAELDRLVRESKETKQEVKERIVAGRERVVYVDRVARGIEAAPLPGQCRTPDAVMGADL